MNIWRDNWKPYLALLLGTLAILIWAWSTVQVRAETCGVLTSYYGKETCGGRPAGRGKGKCQTADGTPFDGSQWLVAHKSLPFGTKLRLTYQGRVATVTVRDRGPYHGGRVLDVSKPVAVKLGMIKSGVVRLCMERLN